MPQRKSDIAGWKSVHGFPLFWNKKKILSVPLEVWSGLWSHLGKCKKKKWGGKIFTGDQSLTMELRKIVLWSGGVKNKSMKVRPQKFYLQRVAFLSPLFVRYPDVRSSSVTVLKLHTQWVCSLALFLKFYPSFFPFKNTDPLKKQHRLSV